MSSIEEFLASGFQTVLGDAALEGILVLVFFGAFVLLQNTRLDHKVCILAPGVLLAALFIPWLGALLALILGALGYLALMKFTRW